MGITHSLSGAVQRTDNDATAEIMKLTPTLAVTGDESFTLSLLGSAAQTLTFESIANAHTLYLTSTYPLTIALTLPGPVILPAFKAKTLVMDSTDIVGLTVTNTDISNTAIVRILLGGE